MGRLQRHYGLRALGGVVPWQGRAGVIHHHLVQVVVPPRAHRPDAGTRVALPHAHRPLQPRGHGPGGEHAVAFLMVKKTVRCLDTT